MAGSLFVAGVTAYAAVRAVQPVKGKTVAIAGAAGGVGSIAVQSLRARAGATVLGITGPSNDAWLADQGAIPVNYGDNLPMAARRGEVRTNRRAARFLRRRLCRHEAIQDLVLPPEKVNTIADFEAVKRFGVQSKGGADAATAVLAELADLTAAGRIEARRLPWAFALDNVRERLSGSLNCATRAASWCWWP